MRKFNVPTVQDGVCESKLLLNDEFGVKDINMQKGVSSICDIGLNAKFEDLNEEKLAFQRMKYGNVLEVG